MISTLRSLSFGDYSCTPDHSFSSSIGERMCESTIGKIHMNQSTVMFIFTPSIVPSFVVSLLTHF